jgi:hypothetical protein
LKMFAIAAAAVAVATAACGQTPDSDRLPLAWRAVVEVADSGAAVVHYCTDTRAVDTVILCRRARPGAVPLAGYTVVRRGEVRVIVVQ